MPQVSKRKQHLAKIALLEVKSNKCCKNIRQIKKDRVFQIQYREENNFWDKYKSNLVRNSSSNKSSFNKKEEKKDNNKKDEEKQEEICIYKPGFSFFYLRLGDYLCAIKKIDFLLTKKRKRH